MEATTDASSGVDDDIDDGYWWTHTTLLKEATPPALTAAEAVGACLKQLTQLTQERLQAVETAFPMPTLFLEKTTPIAFDEAFREEFRVVRRQRQASAQGAERREKEEDDDDEGEEVFLAGGELAAALKQLRQALQRGWEEQVREAQEGHDEGLMGGAPPRDISLTDHKNDEKALDPSQSELLQRQVYVSFLRAVVAGLKDAEAGEVPPGNAALQPAREWRRRLAEACFDGLLRAICFPNDEETNSSWLLWLGGLLPGLAPPGDSGGAEATRGEALTLLRGYVECFLRVELQLGRMEWTRGLVRLSDAARTAGLATLRRLSRTARQWMDQPNSDKGGEATVAGYFEECARVLRVLVEILEMRYTPPAMQSPTSLANSVEVGDISVLISFTDFESAARLLTVLQEWLPHCGCLYESATSAPPHDDEESHASQHRLEEAYGAFRERCVALARGIAWYADSSLLLPLYVELLTRVFFCSPKKSLVDVADSGAETCKADAYQRCLSQLSAVLVASPEGSGGGAAWGGASSLDPGFHEVCQARAAQLFPAFLASSFASSDAAAASPASSVAVKEEEMITVLAYSLASQPLTTLRRCFGNALAANVITRLCSADPVLSESGPAPLEARTAAFAEVPLLGDEKVNEHISPVDLFFPKLCVTLRTLEKALEKWWAMLQEKHVACRADPTHADAPLCEDDIARMKKELVGYVSACVKQAVEQLLTDPPAIDTTAAAISELFMLFALLGSPYLVSPVAGLSVMAAATRLAFAASPLRLMLGLHRYIVQLRRYGLAAFFLPPLRALGVEYSAVKEYHQLIAGLRYPVSAEVAYLHELPRGYYCRQVEKLAFNAKTDARAFLEGLVFDPAKEASPDASRVAQLFMDIVVVAGRVVGERLLREASDPPLPDATMQGSKAGGDLTKPSSATAAFSLSSVRVVNSHNTVGIDVLSSLFYGVLRFCGQGGAADDEAAGRQRWLHQMLQQLRKELAATQPTQALSTQDAQRLEEIWARFRRPRQAEWEGGMEPNSDAERDACAWERWLWSVELEDVDEQPLSCAKALLRSCHSTYAQSFNQGNTLLRLRASLDAYGELQKASRAAALERLQEALQQDAAVLRNESAASGKAGDEPTQSSPPPFDTEDLKKQASNDSDKPEEKTGGHGDNQPNPTKVEPEKAADQDSEEGGHPVPPPLLSDTASRAYTTKIIAAVVRRAMISPVDGAVAGSAVRHFLLAARSLFKPTALSGFLRRLMRQISHTFMRPSRSLLECRSLAFLLYYVAETIVLQYRRHCAADSTGEFAGILPSSEKEANSLLTYTLTDVHAILRHCLGQGTFLGDWAAYFVARHTQSMLHLVASYEEGFNRCVVARRGVLARAHTLSPGFQALVKVERPLLEGVSKPAASVAELFTRTPSGAVGRPATAGPLATSAIDHKRNGAPRSNEPLPQQQQQQQQQQSLATPLKESFETRDRQWRRGEPEQRKRERHFGDAREPDRREPSREKSRRYHTPRYSRRH